MRRAKLLKAGVAVLALVASLAACSSSGGKSPASSAAGGGSSAAGGSGSASAATFPNGSLTVGLITDLTGFGTGTYATTEKGLQIAFNTINAAGGANGQQLKFVTADDQSTPAGALSAAQRLVEQDHVPIVIAITSVSFGAVAYLQQKGIPTIGPDNGSPGWTDPKDTAMFDVLGNRDPNAVLPGFGEFAKSQGATICGSISDSDVPNVLIGAKAGVESCVQAGLKAGPINNTVPYGGPDIGPAALEFASGHIDALYSAQADTTSVALVERLTQLGVKLKASQLPIGYGAELLADKPTVAAMQGQGFSVEGTPVEANTPGAQAFKAALVAGGVTGDPGYGELIAWQAGWALKAGLEKFGQPNPTSAQFTTAMRSVNNFDADGALAPEKLDFSKYNNKYTCSWIVTLQGDAFVPVPGSPFCGTSTQDVH
jgi:branched-chain amino acid transport system substrate-binding protein